MYSFWIFFCLFRLQGISRILDNFSRIFNQGKLKILEQRSLTVNSTYRIWIVLTLALYLSLNIISQKLHLIVLIFLCVELICLFKWSDFINEAPHSEHKWDLLAIEWWVWICEYKEGASLYDLSQCSQVKGLSVEWLRICSSRLSS